MDAQRADQIETLAALAQQYMLEGDDVGTWFYLDEIDRLKDKSSTVNGTIITFPVEDIPR